MTRKEEIKQAAIGNFERNEYEKLGFIAGAEWADNHPVIKVGGAAKNYLRGYEDAVDKACEWLKGQREETPDKIGWRLRAVDEEFIEDFRKAMEE